MKTVTLTLTKNEADSLEWISAYGIDEKESQMKSEDGDIYSDSERASIARWIRQANDALGLLQQAIGRAS